MTKMALFGPKILTDFNEIITYFYMYFYDKRKKPSIKVLMAFEKIKFIYFFFTMNSVRLFF